MIRIVCAICKRELLVGIHSAGREVACPACKTPLRVPERVDEGIESVTSVPLPAESPHRADNDAELDDGHSYRLTTRESPRRLAKFDLFFAFAGGLTLVCLAFIGFSFLFPFPFLVKTPFVVATAALIVGWLWRVILAFVEDVGEGLLFLFLPCFGLIYFPTSSEECKRPLTLQILGLVVLLVGSFCRIWNDQ